MASNTRLEWTRHERPFVKLSELLKRSIGLPTI